MLVASGCASPPGLSFATNDFVLHDQNYSEFPTGLLRQGVTVSVMNGAVQGGFKPLDTNGDVWVAQRWVSVVGPDYVGERLYLKAEGERVIAYQLEPGGPGTQASPPATWQKLPPALPPYKREW